jgi:hypothetical protein
MALTAILVLLIFRNEQPNSTRDKFLLPLAPAGKHSYLSKHRGIVNSPLVFFLKFVQELFHN